MYLIKNNILVHAILVQAILVQRYYCAPNILYYIAVSCSCEVSLGLSESVLLHAASLDGTLFYILKNVWRTRIALHKNSLHKNSLHKNTELTANNTKLITTNNKLLTKNTKLITKNTKLVTKNTKLIIIY